MYTPIIESRYPPVFFISGYEGLFPAEVYSDVLYLTASHGFTVFGLDLYWPIMTPKLKDNQARSMYTGVEDIFQQMNWVRIKAMLLLFIFFFLGECICHLELLSHHLSAALLRAFRSTSTEVLKVCMYMYLNSCIHQTLTQNSFSH